MNYKTYNEVYNEKKKKVYSESGSHIVLLYHLDFDDNGNEILVQEGSKDIYPEICADMLSCNINILMQRFKDGDVDAFNRRQAFYADVTEFPSNIAETYERVNAAANLFDILDPEIKNRFSSAEEFYNIYGSPEFFSRISNNKSEVINDESSSNE